MRHLFFAWASCFGVAVVVVGCTPPERDYGSVSSSSSGTGGGMGGMGSSSSSSASGGSGGNAMCAPSTADCNQDGVCETNLLGDVNHCGACDTPCNASMGGVVNCIDGKCQYGCDVGQGDCDQNPATACQDLQSDPKNCGVCGHDCLGGGCMQGGCLPILAIDTAGITLDKPVSLATLGSEIFWGSATNQVAKANIDGSGGKLLGSVNGGLGVYGLAVTPQGIYATNGNRATAFSPLGGSMWQSVNDAGVNNIAAGSLYVLWTSTGNNRVRRADAVGGNQKDLANLEMGPGSIVLEADTARWINTNSGEIRESLVFDGSIPNTIITGPPGGRFLVYDAGVFYWVVNDTVFRAKSGEMPMPLFPTGPDVRALVMTQDSLYWALGNVGEIRMASKMPPYNERVVASGQAEPAAMAVGADSVFWANRGDGMIMRLAR